MNTIQKYVAGVSIILATTVTAVAAQDTPDRETLLKTCQAATWDAQQAAKEEKHNNRRPISKAARYLASGIDQRAKGIGKDLIFCFSMEDGVDPYEGHPPKDQPYEEGSFRMVDGTTCTVMKYPDHSLKVLGGFADGTIIAPLGGNKFVVGYPNGARGMMEKSGSEIIVHRPDKTVTTLKKTLSGGYTIRNSELGFMGEGVTDQTGLRFDFNSYGKGTL